MPATQHKRAPCPRLLAALLAGGALVAWQSARAEEPNPVPPPAPPEALGSLNEALAEFRARVEALSGDSVAETALAEELAAARERIEQLDRTEAERRARIEELGRELGSARAELELRSRRVAELEEQIGALHGDLAMADDARAAAEAQVADLSAQAEAGDAELAAARERVKRGEAEIAGLRGLREESTAQIAELERELQRLEGERGELATQAAELETARAAAERAAAAAGLDLAAASERTQKLQAGMDEAEAVMANLQTALQEAQAQSEAAVAERDKLRTNLGSVRETLAAERAESGALAERHAALEAEADQLREQATGLAARVTDLEAAAGRSVAEINGMADELVGQLQHGRELAEVVATVRAERAALRGALMRERDRIEPLEAEVARLEAELAEPGLSQTANGTGALQARLTEVERERGRLREELAAVKQIAGSKLDAVVKAEARVADLTAELERTRAELQRVRNVPITQDERSVEAKLPAPGEPQFAALEAEGLRFDRSAEGWLVAIADGVEFAPDSAILAPSADRTLAKVAELIDAYPGRPVLIRGHTDGLGEAAYNRALSADRAEAVRDYLAGRFRIDAERIEVEGLGESRPLASNATAEGRRANRRVEIVIRE